MNLEQNKIGIDEQRQKSKERELKNRASPMHDLMGLWRPAFVTVHAERDGLACDEKLSDVGRHEDVFDDWYPW